MRKFYLVDFDHDKSAKKHDKLYMVAANIAIKYGNFGRRFNGCDEGYIQEFWDGDDCPSFEYFRRHVKVSVVKWYIHNKIDLKGRIWGGDFLHGIATTGEIIWGSYRFPSLYWRGNESIYNMLSNSGFGGKLSHYDKAKDRYSYGWCGVPALYLRYDEDSPSFMAGLLASGAICQKNGLTYAKYNSHHKPYLKKWHIPIEEEIGRYSLVSPIWASLFVFRMPKEIRDTWLNIENPFGRDIYPPILWKTYADNQFPKDGIPYLRSRRWIYSNYKSEAGAMKTLEKERVERSLTQLDKRVRQAVHEWRDKNAVLNH